MITRRQQLGTESPPPEQAADDDGEKPLEVGAPTGSDLPSYGTGKKAPRAKGKAKAKAKAKTEAKRPKAAAKKSAAKKKVAPPAPADAPREACCEADAAGAPQDDVLGHEGGPGRDLSGQAPRGHEVESCGAKAAVSELEMADPKDPPSRKRPNKQDAKDSMRATKSAKKDQKAKETKAKGDTNEDPGDGGEAASAAPAAPGAKGLKTWAGRYIPNDTLGARRFLAMRDVYMQFVAPLLKAQSRYQDRWPLPLTMESL